MQSTTAMLYVNPRLDDTRALAVLGELVENEKEHVQGAGCTQEEILKWISSLISSVEKRVSVPAHLQA